MPTENNHRPNEVIPNPDPSVATRDMIDRAMTDIEGKFLTRIEAMEKAVTLFHDDLTRVPTSVDRQILALREVLETNINCIKEDIERMHAYLDKRGADIKEQITHLNNLTFGEINKLAAVTAEQFAGISGQFTERDTRTDQRAGATKLAVDAAFAAAKEATSKIEAGFTKSIDALQELLKATAKATDDKISDLKDRLTAIESRTQVSDPNTAAALEKMASTIATLSITGGRNEGHAKGVSDNVGLILSVAAIAITLGSVFWK